MLRMMEMVLRREGGKEIGAWKNVNKASGSDHNWRG